MKYYFTTPIYYVNAAPHIGHTYTTLAADTIKKFKTQQGFTPVLTTGTDEHGQKVERSAEQARKTPQEFADVISNEFRQQWDALHLDYNHFIRTTDARHHKTVQWLFERCLNNGYAYKGSYTGAYCVSDERYVNEVQPGESCPDCGRATEAVTEENYFFRLSAFTEKLLDLYEKQPDFIQPESRRNEVLSFVRQGLQDLSISRSTLKWGIPLPVEGNHVFYVWFDALTAYITAQAGDNPPGELWPADLHLVGKEILRFHGVFWPAFLMAADVALPKKIFAHGWLLFDNEKMSKSKGNLLRTAPIQAVMGFDALRYFLLREIVFGQDGSFTYELLINRYNADLANGLGNLVSRTLTMIQQYREGVTPAKFDAAIGEVARKTITAAQAHFEAFEFSRGLETIWALLGAVDKFIVEQAPWKLARATEAEARERLDTALGTAAETLRLACVLLYPVMPECTGKIWSQLGMTPPLQDERLAALTWGQFPEAQKIGEIAAVFPRVDAKVAIERMSQLEAAVNEEQNKLLGKPVKTEEPPAAVSPIAPPIDIDDFVKVDLRVGLVLSAEPVKGADKLLHLKVDLAEAEPRTIVAGIAGAYPPEQLVGRRVVIVANLQPRKLRGILSNGMIVAASLDGGKPVLASFLEDVPVGARLK